MWWGNAQGSMAKDFEDLLAFGAPGAGGAETKQIFDRGCETTCHLPSYLTPVICHLT